MCCFSCVVVQPHPWGQRLRGRQYKHRDKRYNQYNGDSTKGSSCEEQFTVFITECMEPFSKKVHRYTELKPKDPFVQNIFVNHACRQYKKMLLCIHTSLTNCPTKGNMEIVQEQLGQPWISKVNTMCNIQSNSKSRSYQNSAPNSNSTSETDKDRTSDSTVWKNRTSISRQPSGVKNKSIDDTVRSFSAKSTTDTIVGTASDSNVRSRQISQIPATFLQFHDKDATIIIHYGQGAQPSSESREPTMISYNQPKISELDLNNKNSTQPRLLRWLYIVINASNLNTLQVGISSELKTKAGIGRRWPEAEAMRSVAKNSGNQRLLCWHLLLVIAVIFLSFC
ncbi:hypothetical protein FSP39_022700 [Pinctada imbricata]|uniref:Uncharacterized protein n=1 Tax=Pinctada imbricata TaxID=66713 RepID=A0AA89CBI7_PINIB|nr:hypothetical protein FSP39_022700 [Pinctada imbricata]